jgi:hypothetical protein
VKPRAADAAIGVRTHSGWATVVGLAGAVSGPAVVLRRRIELADPAIPDSKQPYHAAEGLDLREARPFIRRCVRSTQGLAVRAVRAAVAETRAAGHRVSGCGLLLAAGRPLPGLAAVLASHALIHAAEGEMYRDAVREAARECGLTVAEVREREVSDRAGAVLELSPAALARQLGEWGKRLGPPWRQDEKLATLAAWLALAGRS